MRACRMLRSLVMNFKELPKTDVLILLPVINEMRIEHRHFKELPDL